MSFCGTRPTASPRQRSCPVLKGTTHPRRGSDDVKKLSRCQASLEHSNVVPLRSRLLRTRIDERSIDGRDLAGDGGLIGLEDAFAVEVWHGFDDRVEVHPHGSLFPPSILHHAHKQWPLRRVDEV